MMKIKNILTVFFLGLFFELWAQGSNNIEMADVMRSNGKIYVVVGVVLMILIGFILYLVNTDRKLKKLENEINDKNQ